MSDEGLAKATEVLVAGGADTENARRMLAQTAALGYDEATLLEAARLLVLGREWAAKHQ